MIDIKSPWKSVTDRETWAARGASFVAKAKATKVVWFPPEPVEAGKKAAATAKKATQETAKKSAGAAKKSAGAAKKPTGAAKKSTSTAKKSTGAAKKATTGATGVTNPVRRKKTGS